MKSKDLKKILLQHSEWLNSNHFIGKRANFRGKNLKGFDLTCKILRHADLSNANLSGVNFYYAELNNANLSGANLMGASFDDTDLRGADLTDIIFAGPEFHNVYSLANATISPQLLPWISGDQDFSKWFPTLTIVED